MNDAVARDNKYQYNSKEWNDDFGLNWNDYGARWYDAAIGRFTGVDPIADQFAWVSPFNYAENEPIANIDLWGLQKWDVKDGYVINGPYKNQNAAESAAYSNKQFNTKQQQSSSKESPLSIEPVTDANKGNISPVSWGETQGIYPTENTTNPSNSEKYDPTQWDEAKTKELLEARAGIDYIYENRNDAAHTDKIDLNDPIESKLAPYHLKDNMPEAAPEIRNNESVKFFYLGGTKDAKHTGISSQYWNQEVAKSYGPFYNDGGGDAKRGQIYIIFYSVTPKDK